MTGAAPFVAAVGAVAAQVAGISVLRGVGKRLGWGAEVQRKSVHVMVGLFAMALPALFPSPGPALTLVLAGIAGMLALRVFPGMLGEAGCAIHSVRRRSFGDIWLGTAIGFLLMRSQGHYVLYGLPLAVITLSDAAAALTGSTYGHRRFVTEGGEKSWEGVVAFVMVGWIVSMSMLLLFSDAPRANVIVLGLVVAAFGAGVEAVSWRGLDNLFVPVALHLFLRRYLDASLPDLLLAAAAILAVFHVSATSAARLKLSRPTARGFAIAILVIGGTSGLHGVLLPLAATATYLATRDVLPGRGYHPDLDFLGTLCATAAIWLFVGETNGPTAIDFFNMSVAGMAAAYAVLSMRSGGWGVGRTATANVLAGAAAIVLAGMFPSGQSVAGPFPILVAANLALVAAVAAAVPRLFARWPAPRAAALASILPLTAYLGQTT